MSSFKTPARGRFARHNATGEVDAILAPGALSVNWPDRKIYVGGTNGVPVQFSQPLDFFDQTLIYKSRDVAIYEGNIIRATTTTGPSATPIDGDWSVVLGNAEGFVYEAAITGILLGGSSSFLANTVSIAEGAGIVVDNRQVEVPSIQFVNWGATQIVAADPGETYSLVGISASGVVSHVPYSVTDLPTWRRDYISICLVVWEGGSISRIDDLTVPSGQMSESVRDAYFASDGPYRASGLQLGYNSGTFTLKLSAGKVFDLGGEWRTASKTPNIHNIAEIPVATIQRVDRAGVVSPDETDLDKAQYDNAGVLTAVPAGKATIQYVTALPDFSQIFVQYGQTLYDSAFAAAEALPDDWSALEGFATNEFFVLIGAVIIGADDTALVGGRVINASNDAVPFTPAIAQETSGFLLTDGSRPMGGNLNMGTNNVVAGGSAAFQAITGATIQCRVSVWA